MTETDISELLAVRYAPPAWAYIPQVRNGTGHDRSVTRYADGIAMSLWPSRGLEIHGFEIKVSRSDWIAELRNPEKAEYFVGLSDRWWIVAPKGIVLAGELPAIWGLMETTGKRLKTIREAPPLKPKPLDRLQLAAILRSLQAVATPDAKIAEAERLGMEKGRKEALDQTSYIREDHDNLIKKLAAFEKASGVSLNKFGSENSMKNIGTAVRIVLAGKEMKITERIQDFKKQLLEMIERCDLALNEKEGT